MIMAFLFAIIISMVFSFFIGKYFYEKSISKEMNSFLSKSVNLIHVIAEKGDEQLVYDYIKESPTFGYKAVLYKQDTDEVVVKSANETWEIEEEVVDRVLAGEEFKQSDFPRNLYVGVPFQMNGTNYALFVGMNLEMLAVRIQNLVFTILASILFFGTLMFIVTTHFIVKPIRELTKGTKKVATGDFKVEIESNRNDELGNLTRSFNDMAKSLSQLEEMRQQFVSNVSHEIQSPLTSIKGFARALKDGVIEKEEDQKRYLSIIEKESKRLSVLSQNLLKLATLDSDQPPYSPKEFRLDEQLRRVVIALEPQWKEKNHSVQLQLAPVNYVGDEDQLEQVWVNILSNAIQYTNDGGVIQLKLEQKKEVVVQIKDNGIGISKEEQTRIFERFYKVDKARTRKEVGGNGLGLSIVKKIIQLHRGQIEIDSEVGEGSTFTVTLPQTNDSF